ncbi:MAG: hypothetical protein ABSF14_14710 [Terriglobia bacterium]|jgi:hypothetical protein
MDQELMTEIKKARTTHKDVKNEGTSGDMYEKKGTGIMKNGTSGDVDENKQVNRKSQRSQNVVESKGDNR